MSGLSHVVIGMMRGRMLPLAVRTMLQECMVRGAKVRQPHEPSSALCYARNVLIEDCLEDCIRDGRQTVLLLDDDMVVDPNHLELLCTWRPDDRKTLKFPVRTGVYIKENGMLAGNRARDLGLLECGDRWLFGLGCFAVRREWLEAVGADVDTYSVPGGRKVHAWCTASARNGRWFDDDYSVCARLGGAALDYRCRAGHIKRQVFWPADESLELIERGLPIDGEENRGQKGA